MPSFVDLYLVLRVVTASGAVTLLSTDWLVEINKASGAATVVNLLVTPKVGQQFRVFDGKGDAATHNITLTPASGTINGAGTLVINTAYGGALFWYDGVEWKAQAYPAGGGGGSGTVTSVGLSTDASYLTMVQRPSRSVARSPPIRRPG